MVVAVGLMVLAGGQEAAAQLRPTKPHRTTSASAASLHFDAPSVWRNQPQEPTAQPMWKPSKQDRKAYENCPDPKRYGPKPRRRMVRIW
jgi:hypothetical protein